ncbi:MAG: OmpA family protein [Burkholderiaceae bacterium]|nr:OmpA family protein [Burkholderiaceae bacterium]
MFDELDDGARTGVWVALGIVAFVLFGLIGGLAIRQMKPAAAPMAAAAAAPAAMVDLDALLDVPLAGDLAGTLYFEVGQAGLTQADGPAVLAAIRGAADAAPARRLVISGFHDASGDAQMNHDLAKQRAIAVRDALVGAGVARERLQLRKPASTDGGSADDPQARRVEVHLVD